MKKRIISLVLMIVMVVSIIPNGTFSVSAVDYRIENAVNWAVAIANDDRYGYSQYN